MIDIKKYSNPSFTHSEKAKREEALKLARKIRKSYKKLLNEGYHIEPDESSDVWKKISLAYEMKNAKKASMADIRELASFDITKADREAVKRKKVPARYKGGEEYTDFFTKKKVTAEAGDFIRDPVSGSPFLVEETETRAEAKAKQRKEALDKANEKLKQKRREQKRKEKSKGESGSGFGDSSADGIEYDVPDDVEHVIVVENYLATVISDLLNRGQSSVWQGLVEQFEDALRNVIAVLDDDGYKLISEMIKDGLLPQGGTYIDSDGILDAIQTISEKIDEWKQKREKASGLFSEEESKKIQNLVETISSMSEYQNVENFVRDMSVAEGFFED